MTTKKAILALADGTIFRGVSIGADGQTTGEVVFNTAMTGYQEILTDPSYANQMVTLTYPHIGNTGCNSEDSESGRIHKVWASGLIIRDLPLLHSNFRADQSLSEYLISHGVVAIWLILPVVICLSQRLSHACLSASRIKVKPRKAH